VEIMETFQEKTVKLGSKKAEASPELMQRGIFVQENQPEYVERYQALTAALQKTAQTGEGGPGGGDHG
jgi:2-oxoglutarate ferredoxin oxidoreductase subunit beta